MLEEQGRAALLHHPVGDFGDFEDRIDFDGYPRQFAFGFKKGNKFP